LLTQLYSHGVLSSLLEMSPIRLEDNNWASLAKIPFHTASENLPKIQFEEFVYSEWRVLLLVEAIYPPSRLRFPTHRGIRPLDDAPPSQVLDVLVVVPDLPQEGLGVLADLGGGAVESRRQGEFDQPAVTEVRAERRKLNLNAQSIRISVGIVCIKLY